MKLAKIINVVVEKVEGGMFFATSPQMRELMVSGTTESEVHEAVPQVIREIFDAHGQSVAVIEAEKDNEDLPMPWVIVPTSATGARSI